MNRKLIATASVAAVAGASFFAAAAANADGTNPSYQVYDEGDSPNPYDVVNGLVFYQGADLGWIVNAPLSEVDDLDYTVAEGTSYAPSFQLVTKSDIPSLGTGKYARLVWEPYQQTGKDLDADAGTYTDLQDGVWWTNKIANPAPGSQSDPQPLDFFTTPADEDGAGWQNVVVTAVDVHQGTTTDATHLVTQVVYNGTSIPLGTEDTTPFSASDLDNAVAAQKATDDAAYKGYIAPTDTSSKNTALADYKKSHPHTDAEARKGYVAKSSYDAQVNALRALQAKSPLTVSGTLKVGKKLSVSGTKYSGVTYKYQWYVGGKKVSGATKSTYTVAKSAKGHSVAVKVTRSYKDAAGKSHSVTTTSYVTSHTLAK